METQVQQKVTGKSIQIELISPSLPLPLSLFAPFSFHTGYKARFLSESHFNYCHADTMLITKKSANTMIFSLFMPFKWQMWSIVTRKKTSSDTSEIVWKKHADMNVLRLNTNHPLSQRHHSFLLFLSFPSSLAPLEGQWQLHAGDKRVQRWALGSDWLTQLLRWCEDCRLRLSKDHSAHGRHLVTSLPQMPDSTGLTHSRKPLIRIVPPFLQDASSQI